MMGSRLSRDFLRIGMVLAAPPLLLAIWFGVLAMSQQGSAVAIEEDRMLCVFWAVLAVVLHAAACAIGWIADGFLSRPT